MDKIDIEGVILSPQKRIHHPKGDIYHCMKESDVGYLSFGEAYFSTINTGEIKGWKMHKMMTLNLLVPLGEIKFVIYDDRQKSKSKTNYCEVTLSQTNYQRLTVPPGLWLAFKGKGNKQNLILNIANMEHDPNEIDRLELDQIYYDWDLI